MAFETVYQECLDSQYNKLIGSPAGSLTGAQLVAGNPYCAHIQREYAPSVGDYYGALRTYLAPYVNEGGIQSRGIDAELDWGLRFADTDLLRALPGTINVNSVLSYLSRYAVSPFSGAAYVDYTGTDGDGIASFRYRLLSTFGYSVGPATIGFRWQHLPSILPDPASAPGTTGANAYDEVDMFARWTINQSVELRAGIDNPLNAWPPTFGANPTDANVGTTLPDYDVQGRRFYVGANVKF